MPEQEWLTEAIARGHEEYHTKPMTEAEHDAWYRTALEQRVSELTTDYKMSGWDLAQAIFLVTKVEVEPNKDNLLETLNNEQVEKLAEHLESQQ